MGLWRAGRRAGGWAVAVRRAGNGAIGPGGWLSPGTGGRLRDGCVAKRELDLPIRSVRGGNVEAAAVHVARSAREFAIPAAELVCATASGGGCDLGVGSDHLPDGRTIFR